MKIATTKMQMVEVNTKVNTIIVNRREWVIGEVLQTSKEQTTMSIFMLEGPRPCKLVCFALKNYVELLNRRVPVS